MKAPAPNPCLGQLEAERLCSPSTCACGRSRSCPPMSTTYLSDISASSNEVSAELDFGVKSGG